jgi:hypothetical protein
MVKLQAQVLIPVLKAFRTEIGEDRANQIVRTALREWTHKLFQAIGKQLPGSPRQKWDAIYAALVPWFSSEVKVEMPDKKPGAPEISANGRRFSDFLRELGEQDLRSVPVCEMDLDMAAVPGSEVRIDSGANHNEWCEVW